MNRWLLSPVVLALILSACGTSDSNVSYDRPLQASSHQSGVRLGDHASFHSDGPRWWADGPRWWADGPRWWADGPRWWADGPRWWADGVFGLMPGNTAAFRLVNLDQAHSTAARMGEGVTVALIDSGIDAAHPLLRGSVLPGHDWVGDDADAAEGGSVHDLAFGHGTAVAGIVRQVAPGARLLPLRVLSPDGSGSAEHVAAAIRYAVDKGVQVINLSISAPASSEATRAALQYAASRGVLVVAASGNDGGERPQSPASFLDAKSPLGRAGLSVSAVDEQGAWPQWSTRGGELLAPGVALHTAYPDGRVVSATGSSFAAPLVSGVLALALAEGRNAQDLAGMSPPGTLMDAATLLR